ncbi:hypothetical protein Tco_1496624, partial [Tanacetum coccineum]
MEESLNNFMVESAKRHDENSNLIKEIRVTTDAAIRNQGASIKALEIQIVQMGKELALVVENMDPYRDQEMGDVIFGESFCREICVKARRFDRMITIYNGNDSVPYQVARSHPRFKNHTNAQCNKIPPILK